MATIRVLLWAAGRATSILLCCGAELRMIGKAEKPKKYLLVMLAGPYATCGQGPLQQPSPLGMQFTRIITARCWAGRKSRIGIPCTCQGTPRTGGDERLCPWQALQLPPPAEVKPCHTKLTHSRTAGGFQASFYDSLCVGNRSAVVVLGDRLLAPILINRPSRRCVTKSSASEHSVCF